MGETPFTKQHIDVPDGGTVDTARAVDGGPEHTTVEREVRKDTRDAYGASTVGMDYILKSGVVTVVYRTGPVESLTVITENPGVASATQRVRDPEIVKSLGAEVMDHVDRMIASNQIDVGFAKDEIAKVQSAPMVAGRTGRVRVSGEVPGR
jgi:hypothetical protein